MQQLYLNNFFYKNPTTGEFVPIAGIAGESAYEIAVRLGTFTGTEEEWNNALETERAAAVASIQAETETSKTEIETAKTDAKTAIDEKAKEALETIPEDYTDFYNETVKITEQALTDEQQVQARENIGAASEAELGEAKETLANASGINDGAITPNKTSFFGEGALVEPTNWLDMTALTSGYYVSSNGLLAENSAYTVTDFIPVKVGDTIRYQASNANNGFRFDIEEYPNYASLMHFALYDENKKYIDGTKGNGGQTYTVNTEGAKYFRMTMSDSMIGNTGLFTDIAIVKGDTAEILPYSEYFDPYYTGYKIKDEYLPTNSEFEIKAFLPSEICCAIGRTIEIYNMQVCPQGKDYYFQWNCSVGKAMKRKFSITGTSDNVGEYTLKLTIRDKGMNEIWSGESTLKIVAGYVESMTLLNIGDSLTNGKNWLGELRLLNSNISLVGTKSGNVQSSDNHWQAINHEGRSGFSAYSYLTDTEYTFENEGVHPFWDATNERFNWNHYVTNSLAGKSPDAVQIFLGTNGIELDPTNNANAIKQIVDYIRQDDSTIPIYLAWTLYRGNQDGLGVQTGSDGYTAKNAGKYKLEEDMKVFNLMVRLNELMSDYSNLYFVPISLCHDSEYNFGAVETPVNPRATQTELMPTEATHPQAQGYYQMADIMYSVISAHQDS